MRGLGGGPVTTNFVGLLFSLVYPMFFDSFFMSDMGGMNFTVFPLRSFQAALGAKP